MEMFIRRRLIVAIGIVCVPQFAMAGLGKVLKVPAAQASATSTAIVPRSSASDETGLNVVSKASPPPLLAVANRAVEAGHGNAWNLPQWADAATTPNSPASDTPAMPTESNTTGDPNQEQEAVKKAPVRLDPGEKRPQDQFQINVFDRPLTIGGQYEIQPQYRKDAKLDPNEEDDLASIDQSLKFELLYDIAKATTVFIQGTFFYEAEVYSEDGQQEYTRGFERQQSWIFMQNLFDTNISMQVGRQRFADKRQWWWNDELDAVRFYYNNENVAAEVGFAQEAAVKRTDENFIEPEHDDIFRVLGDVVWQWQEKQILALFFLSQTDHSNTEKVDDPVFNSQLDVRDADLIWLGGRAFGKFRVNPDLKLGYWFDSAFVFGRQVDVNYAEIDDLRSRVDDIRKSDVLGWAIDTGATWFSKLPLEPYFTVGYARASGDDNRNDGMDTTYRQSRLQGNKVKFGSSQRFRWYGEAFRPELSNMDIWSAGMGVPLSEESSIDFVYHNYRQAHASPFILDSRLRTDPNGIDRHLGEEFDLIVSLDEGKHSQFQLICAVFKSGDAFGELSGNTAATVLMNFRYGF